MPDKPANPLYIRLLPVLMLVAALVAFFSLGLHKYFTLDQLKENRVWLLDKSQEYGVYAVIGFAVLYCLLTAVSFPGGLVLTITSGFLFGNWLGTLVVIVGATVGAVLVFIAVRFGVGNGLNKKAGSYIQKMEDGFRENAFNYLLVLRLIPLFPFWLVNIVPAVLGVSTGTFAIATFLGIIPGTFVFVTIGSGIGAVFDSGQDPNLSLITKPEILLPIIGLSLLSLSQVVYKKYKHKKST